MNLPILQPSQTSSDVVDTFYGYDHNLKIGPGAFYDTKNLTSAYFPMLANRGKRVYITLTAGQGLIEKQSLCHVDNGTLYMNHVATTITGLSAGQKSLVSMGAYIVIFPDKKYYNTEDPTDYGSLEASYTNTSGTSIVYSPCNADGTIYTIDYTGSTTPDSPLDGQTWLTTDDGKNVLKTWSESMAMWTEIPTVYTKVKFTTQGQLSFKEYDGVTISGAYFDDLNGEKVLYAVGGGNLQDDYIVVIGLCGEEYTEASGSITIERKVPDMDFVCECQNRLWGCFYGNDGTQNLNEIYCCALGDFKNWSQYMGVATDAWRASVGTDGPWTGAVNYLGHPTFFKENHVHIVSVSSTGAHRIEEMACRGVQRGSSKSLQIINETLYYKSRTDVVAWQGGFPTGVSASLGDAKYYNAVAGVFGQRYYISMEDSSGDWHLFTYDDDRNMWLQEDDLQATAFARVGDELFCLTADNKLWGLNGVGDDANIWTTEETPEWMAETGVSYYQHPNKKYLSRFNIRLKMEAGSTMTIYLEYDSSGEWVQSGTVQISRTGTATLPIRPRRCDHMRMKLVGTGDVRIYSIAKILEVGSDV